MIRSCALQLTAGFFLEGSFLPVERVVPVLFFLHKPLIPQLLTSEQLELVLCECLEEADH